MTANTPADSDQPVGSGRVQPVLRRAQRPATPGRLERRRPCWCLVVDRLEVVEDRRLQAPGTQIFGSRVLGVEILPLAGVHARQR